MHPQRRIPSGRNADSVRRPRPAPLSPPPEWRAHLLFVEPRYSSADLGDDVTQQDLDLPEPQVPRSRRRAYRP
ncbi:hypothetical protein ACWDBD_20430 [Streptomyces sp. NPDC001118]|uniref:hypothetical protein n=1 Tax=unclassified Streptomyces TaxID=2593676 RepID=UPI0033263909